MDKSLAGLLGGVSALALAGAAHAASATSEPVNTLRPAQSYAELLDPIPNAAELLKAENQRPDSPQASVQLAQYYAYPPHHHHHHHHYGWGWNPHQWWAWQHRHHHHHHHHYYPY
ncbi:MAG: hypothetical protein JO288_04180 [Hyphomicrobiales bacterium]|nr:hypothetical protein [Hyphomicrobiales bacterium]